MGDRRATVVRDLEAARTEGVPVRLRRAHGLQPVEGYVAGVGDAWVLVARLVEGLWWHGWTAVRLGDLRRVDRPGSAAVVERMLRLRAQWPPAPPGGDVDLSDVRALLASLQRGEHLVAVHAEHDDPGMVPVGAVRRVGRRTVRLLEVTPDASWARRPTKVPMAAITRIDAGSRHAAALRSVAGPPPP